MSTDDTQPTPVPTPTPAAEPAPAPAAPPPKPALASLSANINSISEIIANFIGKLVALATRALTPDLVRRVTGWSRVAGNYAVLAGIVLTFIFGIIFAVKLKSFGAFVSGFVLALAIMLTHYVAGRFMASSDKIITGTPGRISSMAVLECFGLLMLLGAIAVLGGGIYMTFVLKSAMPLITAIVGALLIMLAAAITLNPVTLGIEEGNASAGEEALGLLSFALKIWLKLVVPLFCLLAVAGCVLTVWGWFDSSVLNLRLGSIPFLPFIDMFMASGMAGPSLVLYACMTPIIVYLWFIFASLVLDLARAILAIPVKLDNLNR